MSFKVPFLQYYEHVAHCLVICTVGNKFDVNLIFNLWFSFLDSFPLKIGFVLLFNFYQAVTRYVFVCLFLCSSVWDPVWRLRFGKFSIISLLFCLFLSFVLVFSSQPVLNGDSVSWAYSPVSSFLSGSPSVYVFANICEGFSQFYLPHYQFTCKPWPFF